MATTRRLADADPDRSVTVLFSAYSDPSELIAEATALAREREVPLELVAFVPTAFLFLVGMASCVAPAGPTADQFERDLAVDVARIASTVPADVPVRWRLFCFGRRQASRRLFGSRRARDPLFPTTL